MRGKNRPGPRRPLRTGDDRRPGGAPPRPLHLGAPPRRQPGRGAGSARPAGSSPDETGAPHPEGLTFGFHAVRTALEQHPKRVERVLLARDLKDGRVRQIIALARGGGVPFQAIPRQALERLAQGLPHQGVAARLSGADLLDEEDLLERLPDRAIVIVLDGVQDPRNLGAILRTAAGFGAAGVFLPGHRAAGLSPAAARTAAGGLDLVPVARAGNLSRLLERLADRGVTPVALDARGGRPPWESPLEGPIALVAGNEEKGVRPSVLEACPVRVWIPIRPELGSLNVSVAVGIVLAEACRQRLNPPER